MDLPTDKPCRKRNGKETAFDFKLFVIEQINNGQISTNFASKKYNISRSTMDYWRKKLSNFTMTKKFVSKEDEIRKLRERIEDLEGISDFQQDVIIAFERTTGKELSKKLLPKKLADVIQKKKRKLKD